MSDANSSLEQQGHAIEGIEPYKLLVDGIIDHGVFLLDAQGYIVTWNKGAEHIHGYTAAEITGKHFSIFYSPEALAANCPKYKLETALKTGRFEQEGWLVKKDGICFWACVVITPAYITTHELIGYSLISKDLTHKKAEQDVLAKAYNDLQASEERYRLLIDGVADYAIFMLDSEGYVSTWNEGARRIKGYEPEDIIGRHFSIFYPLEALERGFPAYELQEAVKQGRFEDEGWRLRKDGSTIWANIIITPMYNEKGTLLGFSKITRDLSERQKNKELMRKNRELLKINRDLDNFVYAASHDLKAPISNLEGLIAILWEEDTLRSDKESYQAVVSRIDGSIKRLKNVVTELAEVMKVQQENEEQESILLPAIVDDVLAGLNENIQKREAVVEVNVPEGLTIHYSRKNLRSILYNLISNALKYSSDQRKPLVKVSFKQLPADTLLLEVADNGLGIEPEQTKKIFSMFKRIYTHVEGAGIGLYIVKRILENSDDRIEVESEVGKGSTFKVYFSF